MEIKALPKKEFDALMEKLDINDSNVEAHKNLYIISINYSEFPEWLPEEAHPHFKEDHKNVLRLFYDDVLQDTKIQVTATKEWMTAKAISKEEAIKVVEFISNIKKNDDTKIFIHCKAGKSRSVATAHFISEFFGQNTSLIYTNPEQIPNLTVLKMLREAKSRHAKKECPRCHSFFQDCNPGNCWCEKVETKTNVLEKIKEHYDTCLCPDCLNDIKSIDDIVN